MSGEEVTIEVIGLPGPPGPPGDPGPPGGLTTEAIQDIVGGLVVAGTAIDVNYNDTANTLTISVTGLTSGSVSDFAEAVQDQLGAHLAAGTGITVTYDDPSGNTTVAVDTTAEAERIRDTIGAALVAGTNVSIVVDDSGNTITINSSGASLDTEQAMDVIAAMLQAGTGIDLAYDDPGNTLTVSVSGLTAADISDFNTAIFAASIRSTFNNTNKTMTTELYLAQVGTLSAPRTVTLPQANTVPAGRSRVVTDESGSVTATNTIGIAPHAGDTVNRSSSPYIITSPDTLTVAISDGVSNWTIGKANSAEVKQLLAGAGIRLTTSGDSTTADVIMQIDEFSTVGTATYVKPANALYALVDVAGAGLGGASGRLGAAGSIRGGGGGGGAGGHKRAWIAGTDLGANETVTIGDGGAGGVGPTGPTAADGQNGGSGGDTSFGSHIKVSGNGAFLVAAKGTNGPGGAGGVLTDCEFGISQPTGGATSSTAAAGDGGVNNSLPGAGGGGGGIDASNVARNGGAGGAGDYGGLVGTAAGGTAGTAGTGSAGAVGGNGGDAPKHHTHGGGGGGGAPSTSNTVNAGNGGTGGFPGGGGGGGGAGTSGSTAKAGNGGKGGRGRVRVVTFIATT